MAELIKLKTISDSRGDLTVIEKDLPFKIKRVFYIYNFDESERGFHKHLKTVQAAIAIKGSCRVHCQIEIKKVSVFELKNPDQCLIIKPEDYRWMDNFTKETVLLVIASELFDENDYIRTKY